MEDSSSHRSDSYISTVPLDRNLAAMATPRIVVLGAGFGGLELAASLSAEFGDALDLVLIDKSEGFVFGFSKLDVMFGRSTAGDVLHRYADLHLPGVRFVRSAIRRIDPVAKRVTSDAGEFEADVLVVALGADLVPSATPGLVECGHEFYTVGGAFALRDVLADFAGGQVVVGVTSTPFKCPPAPSETALLMHDLLRDKGLLGSSHVSLVMPFGQPIPPSPAASAGRPRGVRRARHQLASGPAGARARPAAQGRPVRRRRRARPSTCSSAFPCIGHPRSWSSRGWLPTAGCRSIH